jgi:hypothetical protein
LVEARPGGACGRRRREFIAALSERDALARAQRDSRPDQACWNRVALILVARFAGGLPLTDDEQGQPARPPGVS